MGHIDMRQQRPSARSQSWANLLGGPWLLVGPLMP